MRGDPFDAPSRKRRVRRRCDPAAGSARRSRTRCWRSTRARTDGRRVSNASSSSNSSRRAAFVAACEMNQAQQPVQRDALKRDPLTLVGLRRESRRQLALGFGQHLTRHVDRRGQPVRQREIRQQRERPLRRAQPLFTPARRTRGGSGGASCPARGSTARLAAAQRVHVARRVRSSTNPSVAHASPDCGSSRHASRACRTASGERGGVGRGSARVISNCMHAGVRQADMRGRVLRNAASARPRRRSRARGPGRPRGFRAPPALR